MHTSGRWQPGGRPLPQRAHTELEREKRLRSLWNTLWNTFWNTRAYGKCLTKGQNRLVYGGPRSAPARPTFSKHPFCVHTVSAGRGGTAKIRGEAKRKRRQRERERAITRQGVLHRGPEWSEWHRSDKRQIERPDGWHNCRHTLSSFAKRKHNNLKLSSGS